MITIRPAQPADQSSVLAILKELDIYYSALDFTCFYVAEDDQEIVGMAQFTEYDTFYFLGSLGVKPTYQKRGVGKIILNYLFNHIKKDVYIYTVIPNYFKRYGFEIISPIPPYLPAKDRYECEDCFSDRCVCMKRSHYAA